MPVSFRGLLINQGTFEATGSGTLYGSVVAIGGVTPFALPGDLPIWVDSRVMDRERVILGGGSRDRKVLGPPSLLTAIGAEVVDELAKEPPAQ